MKYASRILVLALLVSIGLGTTAGASTDVELVGGTNANYTEAEWAVNRFEQAGLELPAVMVQFHASDAGCDGYDGVFRSRENPYRIDVCTPNRYIILHELAHAWEHHTLIDDVRQQFMDLRGLEVWNGNVPWQDRGVEDLAEVITAVLVNCSAGPDGESENLAFEMITGGRSQCHLLVDEQPLEVRSTEDPLDADVNWDELR